MIRAIYPSDHSFHLGANLPWLHYGHDFGRAWGHSGVSHRTSQIKIKEALMHAKDAGATFIRWFLFSDGRALGTNAQSPLEDIFFEDVHAALELAQECGLQIIFVLFDYQWFKNAYVHRGVQLFGRASWLSPPERIKSFERFVGPLLDSIQNHPALWLVELMNEPEWLLHDHALVRSPLAYEEVLTLLGELNRFIHARAPEVKTTLGCAHSRWLSLWQSINVDVEQVHHYEGELPPAKGILLGEFSSTLASVLDVIEKARALRYGGAAPWSLLSSDEHSDADALVEGLAAFRTSRLT